VGSASPGGKASWPSSRDSFVSFLSLIMSPETYCLGKALRPDSH
ncbi:MAG: hypothetical protein ACI9W7_001344, partial [Porticoccaceae bacterium]